MSWKPSQESIASEKVCQVRGLGINDWISVTVKITDDHRGVLMQGWGHLIRMCLRENTNSNYRIVFWALCLSIHLYHTVLIIKSSPFCSPGRVVFGTLFLYTSFNICKSSSQKKNFEFFLESHWNSTSFGWRWGGWCLYDTVLLFMTHITFNLLSYLIFSDKAF